MFQLNLERENQISVTIKMWKKHCLHSLSPSLTDSIGFVFFSDIFTMPLVLWLDGGGPCWALSAPVPWLMDFSLVSLFSPSTLELLFIPQNPAPISPPLVSLSDCPGVTSVLS